jgi:hypothetical protein
MTRDGMIVGAAQVFISSIDMNPAASAMRAPDRPKPKPAATGGRVPAKGPSHSSAMISKENAKSVTGVKKKKKSKGKAISALLGKSTVMRKKYGGLQ